MQRVAMKLHESLELRDAESSDVDYDAVLLRSSWTWTHVKVVPFLLWAAWVIAQKARRENVDMVLFSSMVTAAVAVPLRPLLARHGIRTAAIVHGLDVTTPFPPYQWFVPKVFDALDRVLPVSRATGEDCMQRGLPERKVQVLPNGIDPDRFRLPESREQRRQHPTDALGSLPNDALLVCSVGRQVKRKGFEWFIDTVMPKLPGDVHYWLAGDGPVHDAIQSAIDRNGLNGRVRLLGHVTDTELARLYRGADLFIMPNVPVPGDMEGFGVVMLEAAGQCGPPAVAARLEGIRDVITDGMNGHGSTRSRRSAGPPSPGTAFASCATWRRGEREICSSRISYWMLTRRSVIFYLLDAPRVIYRLGA